MSGPTPERFGALPQPDWEALARYLAGESQDEERERVRAWLAANPEDHKVIEALDRLAEGVSVEVPAGLDVEVALRKAKAARGATPVVPIDRGRRATPGAPWWQSPAFRIAAVLAVAAVGGLLWQAGTGPSTPQVAEVRTYRAGLGKPDSINLSDGSRAVLAPGSELAVAGDYGSTVREVRLTGQGWFNVVHDDAKPFVVHTADAEVRDVGTVFTVNDRDPGRVRVAVHEGAVLVRGATQSNDQGVLLHQGDEAVVEQGAVTSTARGTLSPDAADWVSGRLRFRDVPLAEVASTLKRWYGMELRITDAALAAEKVSIDVNAGSIEGVPQELALSVGGEITRRGDTLIVRPAGRGR